MANKKAANIQSSASLINYDNCTKILNTETLQYFAEIIQIIDDTKKNM